MITTVRKMTNRKAIAGGIASVVVLVILEAIGYAMVRLISGIPMYLQVPFYYWIGGFSILFAFGFGMIVNSIAVKSWDTWIDSLGPTQIAVLVEMLVKRQDQLEEDEE